MIIGLEVGYKNPSHFAQVFRRVAGVTPTEFGMRCESRRHPMHNRIGFSGSVARGVMQNLKTEPVGEADLAEYLKSSDFQFELEVFQLCLKGGAAAEHGGTYQAPVTKKDRQFDIRMRVEKGPLIVKFAIECKNLTRNFPLLVSRVPRRSVENFHEIVISTPRSQSALAVISANTRACHAL